MIKILTMILMAAAASAADITLYETWVPTGVSTNWVPVSRWATTQEVAEAVAPLATTQDIASAVAPLATEAHVAQAIAGKVDIISGLASNLWLQGDTIVTDSYTNLLWRNVYSNGWHWLVAYTNTGGGQ